jgi:hypothetical protein
MTQETQDYLATEVAELQKNYKIGLIAMALITVILIGYFQWMKSMVAEIVAPQNLSTLMVSEVRRNLPTARIALQTNLTAAAPEVIEFVANSVLDEALPMMSESARALFREYSRELAGYGKLAAVQSFTEIVKTHKTALAKSRETAEPGMYTPDTISEQLSKTIDAQLATRITETPVESLATKLDESVNALHNINQKLNELSGKKKLTRKEELGRKLITTWWTFLNRSDGPESAQDKLLDTTTARPITAPSEPIVPGDGTE